MTAAFLLMCGCVWVREREREGHVNWKSNSNFNRKNIEFVRWQQHWHRIQAEKDLTEAALTGAAKNQPSAILHQRTSKFAIWFSQTRSECHQFIIVHNISSPFPDRIFFSCFISPPKIHFIVAIERLNRLTWLVWNPCAGSGTTCPISLLSLSLSLFFDEQFLKHLSLTFVTLNLLFSLALSVSVLESFTVHPLLIRIPMLLLKKSFLYVLYIQLPANIIPSFIIYLSFLTCTNTHTRRREGSSSSIIRDCFTSNYPRPIFNVILSSRNNNNTYILLGDQFLPLPLPQLKGNLSQETSYYYYFILL